MKREESIRQSGQSAKMLVDYFQSLNAGDEADWERAFTETWHPEAIVQGRTCGELRTWHRGLLGKSWITNLRVLREIDGYQLEYTASVGGRPDGPLVATLRDALIYRVF